MWFKSGGPLLTCVVWGSWCELSGVAEPCLPEQLACRDWVGDWRGWGSAMWSWRSQMEAERFGFTRRGGLLPSQEQAKGEGI